MGEAKRRAEHDLELDARGIARPRDPGCPACGSRQIRDLPMEELRGRFAGITCDWMGCLDCKAVWEPFPSLYARDPVCADPCDNCAFRPGSLEQQDPVAWRALLDKLHPRGEPESLGMFRGMFCCHKGVPIDLSKGPGNFMFPQKPLLMDGAPVRREDGSAVTVHDPIRMRTCTGFLRMIWAHNAKREKAVRGD